MRRILLSNVIRLHWGLEKIEAQPLLEKFFCIWRNGCLFLLFSLQLSRDCRRSELAAFWLSLLGNKVSCVQVEIHTNQIVLIYRKCRIYSVSGDFLSCLDFDFEEFIEIFALIFGILLWLHLIQST